MDRGAERKVAVQWQGQASPMCIVNVRSAEWGRESYSPPPEPWAQRLRIVMSHMKRYLCLNESFPSRGHE